MKETIYILLLLIFSACNENRFGNIDSSSKENNKSLSQLRWLEGSWLFSEGKNSFHEKWKIENDSTFIGQGFVLSGSDTVEIENLSLQFLNNQLTYRVSISKDRKISSTEFTLADSGNEIYSFENLEHDFPKRIRYRNISITEMEVVIDAGVNSTQINQKFNFKKLSGY